MDLYICRNYGYKAGGREEKNLLFERASLSYREGLRDSPGFGRLLRTPEGKPYFEDGMAPYFSISHTGSLWACLFADRPVGIDLQQRTKADWLKLSERFFTPEEKAYVGIFGEEGFFKVWVRKEAYVKCIGSTLGRELGKTSMVEKGKLLTNLSVYLGKEYSLTAAWFGTEKIDFIIDEISDKILSEGQTEEGPADLYGAYCVQSKGYKEKSEAVKDIWVNILT